MSIDWRSYGQFAERKLREMGVPGAAICVSDASGIVFSRGFGYCDAQNTHAVGPNTIFGIASMSKSVACFAAALLEAEGKLSLDDPVIKYLPAFRIPGIPADKVLVRHLCEHRTGLPPLPLLFWSIAWNTPAEPWRQGLCDMIRSQSRNRVETMGDIIDYLASSDDYQPLGAPGEIMSYSNEGYALLSSVIDAAAGEPLEQYIEKRIFRPLGMTRTVFEIDRAKSMGNITSLFSDIEGTLRCSDIWDNAPPYRGCGWIKSTACDMNAYYMALACGGKHQGEQVFPASVIERIIGDGFEEIPQGRYCFGLNKRLFEGRAICEHSGGLTGVSSHGAFIRSGSFAVTVLTNIDGREVMPLAHAAINLKLGLDMEHSHSWLKPCDQDPEQPERYLGHFYSKEDLGSRVIISCDEAGKLFITKDGATAPMIFCGNDVFTVNVTGFPEDLAIRFLKRGAQCWALGIGSRIFQRIK